VTVAVGLLADAGDVKSVNSSICCMRGRPLVVFERAM
jgi:hypothetical protein